MNTQLKAQLISAFNTFFATFIVIVAGNIASGIPIEWTTTFWAGILVSAVRAVVKPATAQIVA